MCAWGQSAYTFKQELNGNDEKRCCFLFLCSWLHGMHWLPTGYEEALPATLTETCAKLQSRTHNSVSLSLSLSRRDLACNLQGGHWNCWQMFDQLHASECRLLDYQQLRKQLWMPSSQTTTFPVGRSSDRGTAPLSSCDSNPTPTLPQQTWRIRTTPKASTSEGTPLARFEGNRKDPRYEMNSQQKQIRQVAIILTFPPWRFLRWTLTLKRQHRTQPQRSVGLYARKSRLTVAANTYNNENGSDVSNLHEFYQPQPLLFAACDDNLTHPTAELD